MPSPNIPGLVQIKQDLPLPNSTIVASESIRLYTDYDSDNKKSENIHKVEKNIIMLFAEI